MGREADQFHTTRWTLVMASAQGRCLKRGGTMEFVPLDTVCAEDRYRLEQVDALTPEKLFDARWAMALLGEAMRRLHQEYTRRGKTSTFDTLRAYLDIGDRRDPPPYEQAADALEVSVGGVKTLIHRLRKQHTALVREEIARTVSDDADIDTEIHELCEALVAAEGWIMP